MYIYTYVHRHISAVFILYVGMERKANSRPACQNRFLYKKRMHYTCISFTNNSGAEKYATCTNVIGIRYNFYLIKFY